MVVKKQKVIFNGVKTPILNIWYKDEDISRIFDMGSDKVSEVDSDELIKNWLNGLVRKDDIVLINSNFNKNYEYFREIKCKKIGFIHSHQDYCKDTKFLKDFSGFDEFVFLTELQKSDFKGINLNLYSKSTVLPHPVLHISRNINKKNKIVTISRLVGNKPVAFAIMAFSKICNNFLDLKYEIYGVGPDFDNLSKLIKKLNLEDRVFLKGYTDNALKIFEESQLSISLTKFEGFGLSILESLGMSCPVITSDVKYGPNEMIKNNVNGFLVDNEDVDGIANAIKSILDNSTYYQSNCLTTIEANALNLWQEKMIELVER